jgi:hypothetical protein
MRKSLYFAIITALFGCFLGCKKEPKTDFKDLRDFQFLGISMSLPGVYMEMSLDDLIDSWYNSDLPESFVEKKIRQLESMRSREGSFIIFVDTTNLSNTILIFRGPTIQISKFTSKELFLMLDKRFREEAKELEIEFKPLENSYYTLNNRNEILKIKFEWNDGEIQSYGTQYLINIKGPTIGVVIHDDSDDYEGLVRKIKLL